MTELVKETPSRSKARRWSMAISATSSVFDIRTLVADSKRAGTSVTLIPDDLLAADAVARVLYAISSGRIARGCESPAQYGETTPARDIPGDLGIIDQNSRDLPSMFGVRNDQGC